MSNVFLHKATMCLLFLTTTSFIANSARTLSEEELQPQAIGNLLGTGAANPTATTGPVTTIAQVVPATTLPSDQTPVATTTDDTTTNSGGGDVDIEPSVPTGVIAPVTPAEDITQVASPAVGEIPQLPQPEAEAPAAVTAPVEDITPGASPSVMPSPGAVTATPLAKEPSISFFMHDILGGSNPTARVVAGIVATTDLAGLTFSKLNNNIFPLSGGIPLVNPKLNGIITNSNLPNLVGLGGGQASPVFKDSGTGNNVNGNSNNQPFITAGDLPAGFTVQRLMFGSVTVFDDQLTEGQELDSAVIGRAQGLYIASSLEGTSQTIVLTVVLHSGEHYNGVEDTINLFGVHRTASQQSEIAVIGGTGKYEDARGYAALETLLKQDQHTTDGVDTILHFNVFLTEL